MSIVIIEALATDRYNLLLEYSFEGQLMSLICPPICPLVSK